MPKAPAASSDPSPEGGRGIPVAMPTSQDQSAVNERLGGDIARSRNFSRLHRRLSLPNPSGGSCSPIIVSIHVTWSFVLLASASAGWASLRLLLEPQLLQCQRFISVPP